MIITKDIKNSQDDQILSYHEVVSCILNQKSSDVTFVVGSWVAEQFKTEKPLLTTNIDVIYEEWLPEYYGIAATTIMQHPDWNETGPDKPDPSYIWNPLLLEWVAPGIEPIEELKIEKWDQIKLFRNMAEFGGFTWKDQVFDSGQLSLIRIGASVQQAIISKITSTAFSRNWTLKNNSVITCTSDDILSINEALTNHVDQCHAHSASLRVQLDAAKSSIQISNINW